MRCDPDSFRWWTTIIVLIPKGLWELMGAQRVM
jgi:hypothetical protein